MMPEATFAYPRFALAVSPSSVFPSFIRDGGVFLCEFSTFYSIGLFFLLGSPPRGSVVLFFFTIARDCLNL